STAHSPPRCSAKANCCAWPHQALADELGTLREMISRLLHRFERDGLVALSRERVTVLYSAGLRALAALTTG
ncbi:MAG: helix-turn-helix domain-containing protein, partial [Hydrogenophaga sp.]